MSEPSAAARREVDVVVVGGGAAGLAAASWLARYRRSVVVIDSQQYRAGQVERSHGYLGRDPQRPLDLIADGRREVLAYPNASVCEGEVMAIACQVDGLFTVDVTGSVAPLLAHRVVLACGVRDAFPAIEGFFQHYGASVFHCPACDGYETRGRQVVALGWDSRLVGFCVTLLNWATSVTFVTAGHRFEGDDSCRALLAERGIALIEQQATRLVGGRGDLRGIELDDGRVLETSLVFFSVAHQPRSELARALGCELDEEGYLVVDGEGRTSVPGVYAAGDLVPGLQLVQVAAGKGAVAGVGAAQSMFGQRGAPDSPTPAPEPTVPGRGG